MHYCISIYKSIAGTITRPPTAIPFLANPSLHIPLYRSASPLQYLELFFTVSLWQYILDTTNRYATARLGSMPPQRRSLFRRWRDITLLEIKAFVGLIINMGMVQLADIREYWSTHLTLNLPIFRKVIASFRFIECYMLEKYQVPQNEDTSLSWSFTSPLSSIPHSIKRALHGRVNYSLQGACCFPTVHQREATALGN